MTRLPYRAKTRRDETLSVLVAVPAVAPVEVVAGTAWKCVAVCWRSPVRDLLRLHWLFGRVAGTA